MRDKEIKCLNYILLLGFQGAVAFTADVVVADKQKDYQADGYDDEHAQRLLYAQHVDRTAGYYGYHQPVGVLERGVEEITLLATIQETLGALVAALHSALHPLYQHLALGVLATDVIVEHTIEQFFAIGIGDVFTVGVDDITL